MALVRNLPTAKPVALHIKSDGCKIPEIGAAKCTDQMYSAGTGFDVSGPQLAEAQVEGRESR